MVWRKRNPLGTVIFARVFRGWRRWGWMALSDVMGRKEQWISLMKAMDDSLLRSVKLLQKPCFGVGLGGLCQGAHRNTTALTYGKQVFLKMKGRSSRIELCWKSYLHDKKSCGNGGWSQTRKGITGITGITGIMAAGCPRIQSGPSFPMGLKTVGLTKSVSKGGRDDDDGSLLSSLLSLLPLLFLSFGPVLVSQRGSTISFFLLTGYW